MERIGKCLCGSLHVVVSGEPRIVNACHCTDCQRRSGAPMTSNAYYLSTRVRLEVRAGPIGVSAQRAAGWITSSALTAAQQFAGHLRGLLTKRGCRSDCSMIRTSLRQQPCFWEEKEVRLDAKYRGYETLDSKWATSREELRSA